MPWNNTEFILLKLCIASAYLLMGAYFPEVVKNYTTALLVLFVITLAGSMILWINKMKNASRNQNMH